MNPKEAQGFTDKLKPFMTKPKQTKITEEQIRKAAKASNKEQAELMERYKQTDKSKIIVIYDELNPKFMKKQIEKQQVTKCNQQDWRSKEKQRLAEVVYTKGAKDMLEFIENIEGWQCSREEEDGKIYLSVKSEMYWSEFKRLKIPINYEDKK
jgi:hypothetical protein